MRRIPELRHTIYARYARRVAAAFALVYAMWPAVASAETVSICGAAGAKCNHFVTTYINPIIILLSALVGVFAVISIVVAGIQYSSSADDPSAVSKAKQRIFNTIIGLLAYVFLFAFLNYLIPGGIL